MEEICSAYLPTKPTSPNRPIMISMVVEWISVFFLKIIPTSLAYIPPSNTLTDNPITEQVKIPMPTARRKTWLLLQGFNTHTISTIFFLCRQYWQPAANIPITNSSIKCWVITVPSTKRSTSTAFFSKMNGKQSNSVSEEKCRWSSRIRIWKPKSREVIASQPTFIILSDEYKPICWLKHIIPNWSIFL